MFKPLFFLHLILYSFWVHPYYVSIWDLVINSESQTIQVTGKIFLDDLEKALTEHELFSGKFDWNTNDKTIKEAHQKALEQYLSTTFSVELEQAKPKMNILGYESELDVLYVYLESDTLTQQQGKFRVELTFLTQEIPDQMNILHITREGSKKSYLLHQAETKMEW